MPSVDDILEEILCLGKYERGSEERREAWEKMRPKLRDLVVQFIEEKTVEKSEVQIPPDVVVLAPHVIAVPLTELAAWTPQPLDCQVVGLNDTHVIFMATMQLEEDTDEDGIET